MIVHSYHYLVAPLVSLGGLVVILLLCRWVFAPPSRSTARASTRSARALSSRRGDYGLLVPVASVRTRDDAEMLRGVLARAGIRCTVVEDGAGADVLVFPADSLRARDLVSS